MSDESANARVARAAEKYVATLDLGLVTHRALVNNDADDRTRIKAGTAALRKRNAALAELRAAIDAKEHA